MATLCFLLLPGHVDERSLHIAVDDFSPSTGTPSDLLFVGGVSLYATAYLLQTAILHHLFGHIAVLDVLEESVHGSAVHGCVRNVSVASTSVILMQTHFLNTLTLTILLAHLRRKLFIPLDHIVFKEHHNVTLSIPALRRGHHEGQN